MVLLNRIYTRTGDGGRTRLASGLEVAKTSPRVEAYGSVDELNAVIGLARQEAGEQPVIDALLGRVQNDLFDLGADLATPSDRHAAGQALRIVATQTARLEQEIDALNEPLAPLTSFVLPGGSRLAAQLHLARTVCRRAERRVAALLEVESDVSARAHVEALKYLNRLSDLMFVAARAANAAAGGDVLWEPGATR